MLTVVATYRQQGRNVLDYLTSCFEAARSGQVIPFLCEPDVAQNVAGVGPLRRNAGALERTKGCRTSPFQPTSAQSSCQPFLDVCHAGSRGPEPGLPWPLGPVVRN